MEQAAQWWIGDWLEYGERAYGEKYAQAVDETQARTWTQYAWVSRRFQMSIRIDIVGWGIHQILAGVEPERARYALLQRAAKEGWTAAQARQAVRDLNRIPPPPLPAGQFVVYADPPWRFSNTGFDQSAESIYSTMPVEEICALPIASLAGDRAALFLWVPNALLPDGLRVIEAWEFAYKTNRVGVKDRAPGGAGRAVVATDAPSNLRGVCRSCHNRKTMRESNARRGIGG